MYTRIILLYVYTYDCRAVVNKQNIPFLKYYIILHYDISLGH